MNRIYQCPHNSQSGHPWLRLCLQDKFLIFPSQSCFLLKKEQEHNLNQMEGYQSEHMQRHPFRYDAINNRRCHLSLGNKTLCSSGVLAVAGPTIYPASIGGI